MSPPINFKTFSLIIIIIMVFSLESGLLFLIIVVFYLCHFKLPEHQNTKHMKRTFLQILGKCTILQLSKQRFSISGELTCMFPSSLFPTTYYIYSLSFKCVKISDIQEFGINILPKKSPVCGHPRTMRNVVCVVLIPILHGQ